MDQDQNMQPKPNPEAISTESQTTPSSGLNTTTPSMMNNASNQPSMGESQSSASMPDMKAKKSNMTTYILIGIVVVLIIGGGIAYWLMMPK